MRIMRPHSLYGILIMIYDLIAPFYDSVNSHINYQEWADFIEKIFTKEMAQKPDLVLDLGCGTGRMTLELAKRGYDMTGIDYSADMLGVARDISADEGHDILWLCQDMREFELYGTVDAVVCCLDCINHLVDDNDLEKCFSLVHNYLIPDGIFVFDINAKNKFENYYGNNTYVMEEDGVFCVWENEYDEEEEICDFYITLFEEVKGGKYVRHEENQRERMFRLEDVKNALEKCKLEFLGAYSDFDFNPGNDSSDRIYIVAKCRK